MSVFDTGFCYYKKESVKYADSIAHCLHWHCPTLRQGLAVELRSAHLTWLLRVAKIILKYCEDSICNESQGVKDGRHSDIKIKIIVLFPPRGECRDAFFLYSFSLSHRDPFGAHREHMRQMMRSFSEPFGGALMPSIMDGRSRGHNMIEHPSSSHPLRHEHRVRVLCRPVN